MHVVDGDLPGPKPDVIPGHEIVGTIEAIGPGVDSLTMGERVWGSVAGLDLRSVQVLPERPRKPVRPRPLHRLHAGRRLGIYGFDAAAHIIKQVARHEGREIYAFTRPSDATAQRFALQQGTAWAGASTEEAPHTLDAAIIFAR